MSSILSVKENSEEITIMLDKEVFKSYQNQLIINIRQDIEQLSYTNELVRTYGSTNFLYYITKEDEKPNIGGQKYLLENIIETPLDDASQNVIFEISNPQGDAPLIKTKKNKNIPMSCKIGGVNTRQYIVWAYLNSKQVKINGNPYCEIIMNENAVGHTNLDIENTVQTGMYELEIFCVPSPYEGEHNDKKEIISGIRYTVEVD